MKTESKLGTSAKRIYYRGWVVGMCVLELLIPACEVELIVENYPW